MTASVYHVFSDVRRVEIGGEIVGFALRFTNGKWGAFHRNMISPLCCENFASAKLAVKTIVSLHTAKQLEDIHEDHRS